MAYEVARVHELILNDIQDINIQDIHPHDVQFIPMAESFLPVTEFKEVGRTPAGVSAFFHIATESNFTESPLSSSPVSSTETETESDEEVDFIGGLAEQIVNKLVGDEDRCSDEISCALHFQGMGCSKRSKWAQLMVTSPVSSSPSSPTSEDNAEATYESFVSFMDRMRKDNGRVLRREKSSPVFIPKLSKVPGGRGFEREEDPALGSEDEEDTAPQPLVPEAWRTQPNVASSSQSNVASSSQPTVASSSHFTYNNQAFQSMTGRSVKERVVMPSGSSQSHRSWNRPREDERKSCSNVQTQKRQPRNETSGWNQRQNRQGNPQKGGFSHKAGRQNQSFEDLPRMNAGRCLNGYGGLYRSPGGHVYKSGGPVIGGTGMRAVFLGSGGSGRETGGTGVFLPRSVGGGSDHRRKPACATVLLPTRIVQVLNLNVEDVWRNPSGSSSFLAGGIRASRSPLPNEGNMYMMQMTEGNMYMTDNEGHVYTRPSNSSPFHPCIPKNESAEFSLPKEWTY